MLDDATKGMIDNMLMPQLLSMPFTAEELEELFTYVSPKILAEIARRRELEQAALEQAKP